jgi:hypothetical protein
MENLAVWLVTLGIGPVVAGAIFFGAPMADAVASSHITSVQRDQGNK